MSPESESYAQMGFIIPLHSVSLDELLADANHSAGRKIGHLLGGNPAVNKFIASSFFSVVEKIKKFHVTKYSAFQILNVCALVALLFVAGCSSNTPPSSGAPVVTTNPTSVTVTVPATATFNAAATGTPAPTVQWMVSTNGGASFSAVAGATSTTLTITPTTAAENGNQYEAVFTNSVSSATTTAATLTVDSAPAVTTNPVNVTVTAPATATFTAAASGVPAPTVQWMVSTNGGASYTAVAGATSTTLTITPTTVAMSGNKYEAVFTNSVSNVTTTAATLTVNAANTAPAITLNPVNTTVPAGTSATFTAAATGNPAPTVQWMVSTNGGTSFTAVAGATSTTLTITITAAAQNGNEYEAVFTNLVSSATTTAATLTVDFAPTVTLNPVNVTVGNGDPVTFTAAANGNPAPTVQWMVSTNGGTSFSAVPGGTSTTLSFTAATAQTGSLYEAVFTNSVSTSTTTAALLTVTGSSAVAVAITNPATQTFNRGTGGIVNLAASIANGASGTGVNWSVSGVAGGNSTVGMITASTQAGALATYTAPATAPGGGTVAIVATYAGAGGAASSPVTITIVANQNSTLSGQFVFQTRGFQVSGLPIGMVGTFTANGSGALSNVLIDTSAVQSSGGGSTFTSKVAWSGSYAMDTASHGLIHLTQGSNQMNFGFVFSSGSGGGSMVELDAPLGSSGSGNFSPASSSAFTLAAGGLNGNYVMQLGGPGTGVGNNFNAVLGQVVFAPTGSSITSGTVTGSFTDNGGDAITTVSPSTVTLDSDGSGHGTISVTLSNGGSANLSIYISSSGRILILESDSSSGANTGAFRSQTIPVGGFTSANALTGAMLFEALGANTTTGHASVIVGGFSPDPANPTTKVVGEYDASDGGTIPAGPPVQLTGTFTVSSTVPGQGTLTFTAGGTTVISFVFYLRSPNQGFILEESAGTSESRLGQIAPQTEPAGGFLNSTPNGATNAVGTQTATPASGNGVAVVLLGTGTYTATADGSVVGQSPFIGGTSTGAFNYTDSVRGRGTITPATGSIFGAAHAIFYSIDNTGLAIIISLDPTLLEPQVTIIGN